MIDNVINFLHYKNQKQKAKDYIYEILNDDEFIYEDVDEIFEELFIDDLVIANRNNYASPSAS